MKLELLADYLQTQGLGTTGTDIFVHQMDFETQKGILLRLPLDGVRRDWNLPGYYVAVPIQVIVRANDQVEGETLAKQVSAALTLYKKSFQEDGVETLLIQQMLPRTLPVRYPRSDGNGLEWSITFSTTYWAG